MNAGLKIIRILFQYFDPICFLNSRNPKPKTQKAVRETGRLSAQYGRKSSVDCLRGLSANAYSNDILIHIVPQGSLPMYPHQLYVSVPWAVQTPKGF